MKNEFDFEMKKVFSDIKYPCWYARLKKAKDFKKSELILGVSFEGNKKEYIISISKWGNTEDLNYLNRVCSVELSRKLLTIYRSCGSGGVEQYLKNNF